MQVSAAASSPSFHASGLFFIIIIISERRNPLPWLQQQKQQQLSPALQPCSPSPEHWPTGDNISKGVVIATHYIIIISDPSPFTPTAEQSQSTINLNYGKCFGGCFPAPVCSLISPRVCLQRFHMRTGRFSVWVQCGSMCGSVSADDGTDAVFVI